MRARMPSSLGLFMQDFKKSVAVERRAGRYDRLLTIAAVLVLGALAVGFWKANGVQVFAELMSSAWSLCF